jgi:hypothetical protein
MTGNTSPSVTSEVFVERIFDRGKGKTVRPATIRIYKPYQRAPEEWGCRLEVHGLRPKGRVFRHESGGADSVQALFCTLRIAQGEVERHQDELSWWGGKSWESVGFHDATEMQL